MYETSIAAKAERPNPIFISIKETFEKENAHQFELLNVMQNKLHGLFNKRGNEKEQDPIGSTPIEHDFASAMTNQLNQLQRNTQKMEQIINHFDQIL